MYPIFTIHLWKIDSIHLVQQHEKSFKKFDFAWLVYYSNRDYISAKGIRAQFRFWYFSNFLFIIFVGRKLDSSIDHISHFKSKHSSTLRVQFWGIKISLITFELQLFSPLSLPRLTLYKLKSWNIVMRLINFIA